MIKGCGAKAFRGHIFCDRCGACWGMGGDDGDDGGGACIAQATEWLTFYAPITLLAVVAAALVHPLLCYAVFVGLGLFGFVDLDKRARQ